MKRVIYLDHAATTPTDPRVVEAMLPFFTEQYGNPSSPHSMGRKAENAVEAARATLARILHCSREEIVFTACGTESDNMALRGPIMAAATHGVKGHIITAHSEHHAVSNTAEQMATIGLSRVTWLDVDHVGRITPEALSHALDQVAPGELAIVSVMYANNEVGTIQPIRELAALAHQRGALFHTDAVQAGGQLSLDVNELGVDMLSLSAHKFYGPKGVGLFYARKGIEALSALTGGSQEAGRRAGTHNVPLIVGMAKALELAYADLPARVEHYRTMRDALIDGVLALPGAQLSGADKSTRLPNHASFVFSSVEANALLMHLDLNGIAGSSGSACNTGNPKPSEVLISMGYPEPLALSGLRLTVGKMTQLEDIHHALSILATAIERIRAVRETQGV